MSKLWKVALGLAAVSPFFLVAAFAGILAATVMFLPEAPARGSGELPDEFFEAFARHFVLVFAGVATLFLAVLLGIATPMILMLHALSSERMEQDQRTTWVVVLLLGGILVAPFYWYLHVWQEPGFPAT